jgi:hypothetical protein
MQNKTNNQSKKAKVYYFSPNILGIEVYDYDLQSQACRMKELSCLLTLQHFLEPHPIYMFPEIACIEGRIMFFLSLKIVSLIRQHRMVQ